MKFDCRFKSLANYRQGLTLSADNALVCFEETFTVDLNYVVKHILGFQTKLEQLSSTSSILPGPSSSSKSESTMFFGDTDI